MRKIQHVCYREYLQNDWRSMQTGSLEFNVDNCIGINPTFCIVLRFYPSNRLFFAVEWFHYITQKKKVHDILFFSSFSTIQLV